MRCTGSGSPTVIMGEATGTRHSYAFAEPTIAKVTRTCVYDRANSDGAVPIPVRAVWGNSSATSTGC